MPVGDDGHSESHVSLEVVTKHMERMFMEHKKRRSRPLPDLPLRASGSKRAPPLVPTHPCLLRASLLVPPPLQGL